MANKIPRDLDLDLDPELGDSDLKISGSDSVVCIYTIYGCIRFTAGRLAS